MGPFIEEFKYRERILKKSMIDIRKEHVWQAKEIWRFNDGYNQHNREKWKKEQKIIMTEEI